MEKGRNIALERSQISILVDYYQQKYRRCVYTQALEWVSLCSVEDLFCHLVSRDAVKIFRLILTHGTVHVDILKLIVLYWGNVNEKFSENLFNSDVIIIIVIISRYILQFRFNRESCKCGWKRGFLESRQ